MEVTIERILPGGLGLAHADGKTIMVALAAPGDRLRVRIDRAKANVGFASIEEILEPSSVRVEPPCPYFGRCGGCNFQQLNYQAQLEAKKEIIKDCLHRIAKLDDLPAFDIVPAPHQWHYRRRAQWQYDSATKSLGYFESGSRRVCDIAECAVLVPELQTAFAHLRARLFEDALPNEARYFRAIAGEEDTSIAPGVEIAGVSQDQREIHLSINGETYSFNAESFFQTNVELLPQLIDAAIGDVTGNTALELYSGVGLFTLPLFRRFKDVIAVEDDASATNFARLNLANAGLTNGKVDRSDVARWFEAHDTIEAIDFLLLDPPRTGAESRVISGILKLKPKRISYVSCDPATLARDLKKLIAGGFSIESLIAFDMFPQTHHVETVVHLTQSSMKQD